ncbi:MULTISPECIES: YheT family hydrolase [Flavobacteriaceae]|uniref:Alpha/beta fold hydrolase n=2 Tax=Flavobacteriaceae TaxID=49546 RepID=A0A4Y8AV22_9FLAO|nr:MULTISPECIES: alpha/beta fold hydrolase [Flavobacteriaceae]TEW76367.1 alpha/beta fold hydrolase [Gramella jeungdoensis]GGK52311.1 alpha/beta hydrolase [Lutibacter litoralis]
MPIIESSYKPSLLFKNTHINTVYKTLFYNGNNNYKRERISTDDNDFLDLDFSTNNAETLVIAMHGLEGSSKSKYIISVVNHLNNNNIDCVAVNFRGCSGEDNNHIYSYNSGKTDDVTFIINHLLKKYTYKNIVLLGYSMGGNITLKYLGETDEIPNQIKGGIAISTPCDLEGSSNSLSNWYNAIYLNRFMISLKEKTLVKLEKFPDCKLDKDAIANAKTFRDFDNAVTAPLFGYKNASDYWSQCSSKQFLKDIKLPTLIINALDDSFLSKSCYPFKEASANNNITFEVSKYGGHVGFNSSFLGKDLLWSENRILNYINHIIS